MAKKAKVKEKETTTEHQELSMDVAAQHYVDAYKRGLDEGRRQSLTYLYEAKKTLNKKASSMPGPMWNACSSLIKSIEDKF